MLKIGNNSHGVNCITNNEWYKCDGSSNISAKRSEYGQYGSIIPNISNIVCDSFHSFCVLKDGSLYGRGENCYGELGLGDYYHRKFIVKINLNVKRVIAQSRRSFAFTKDGKIFSWGFNNNNQLGRDGANNIPLELSLPNIITIYCDFRNTFAIVKSNHSMNKIYMWGEISSSPRELKLLGCNWASYAVSILYGYATPNCIPAIYEDKLLGRNWTSYIISIVCGFNETFALINDGDVYCWKNNYYLSSDNYVNTKCLPIKLNICNVRLITGCTNYNVFVTASGEIYCRKTIETHQRNSGNYGDLCDALQLQKIDI